MSPVRLHPFQRAFVAVAQRPLKSVGGKQVHIFAVIAGNKRHNPAICPARQRQPGLLLHLAKHTFLRAFARLELSAHAKPFIAVHVVFLFDPMEHQRASVFFNVAKRRLHVVHPFPPNQADVCAARRRFFSLSRFAPDIKPRIVFFPLSMV